MRLFLVIAFSLHSLDIDLSLRRTYLLGNTVVGTLFETLSGAFDRLSLIHI